VIARLMLGRQAGSVGIQGPVAMGITLWTICALVPAPFHFNRSLESGYTGHIISFEPLTGAHAQLASAAAKTTRCCSSSAALRGAAPGETQTNIAVIAAALDRS
jgi:hypothetical protein